MRLTTPTRESDSLPLLMKNFTIIIPHYNDIKNLKNCLESLINLDYPKELYRIIVIDDASVPPIQKSLKATFSAVIFLQNDKNSGPAASRNRGLEYAQGKYIALIDSDVVVAQDWLSAFEKEFDQGEQVICGPLPHKRTLLARLTAITSFGEFQQDTSGYKTHCLTANAAIRSEILLKFRFDESMAFAGEDSVLSRQLLAANYKIRYCVDVKALHVPRLSVSTFVRRLYRYGAGFRPSRSRDTSLPGAWLHKYLGVLSAFPLFFIRVGIDTQRTIKYRKTIGMSYIGVLPFFFYIVVARVVYSIGVVAGYLKRSSIKKNN